MSDQRFRWHEGDSVMVSAKADPELKRIVGVGTRGTVEQVGLSTTDRPVYQVRFVEGPSTLLGVWEQELADVPPAGKAF